MIGLLSRRGLLVTELVVVPADDPGGRLWRVFLAAEVDAATFDRLTGQMARLVNVHTVEEVAPNFPLT